MEFQVFGRHSCPFCIKAVQLLQKKKLAYFFHDFESDASDANNKCKQLCVKYNTQRMKTVPMIFVEGNKDHYADGLIGGYDDLSKWF